MPQNTIKWYCISIRHNQINRIKYDIHILRLEIGWKM